MEHETLDTLLRSLSEEQMLRPQIAGNWSVKDILAHLTWWEQETISEDEDLYTHLMDNTGNHYAEHRMAIETGLSLES